MPHAGQTPGALNSTPSIAQPHAGQTNGAGDVEVRPLDAHPQTDASPKAATERRVISFIARPA